MPSMLHDAFSLVCGQAADRTWAPGGEWLPFCQRCMGLYVGAFAALALALVFRIQPGSRRLQFDGFCLLQMVPLGFHWVELGAGVRTLSGWFFAFGLVDFLWLLPAGRFGFGQAGASAWRSGLQTLLFAAGLIGVLIAVLDGGVAAARALAWLGFAGLIGLALLVLGNLILLPVAAWRRLRPVRRAPAP
jgi:uncharacterized membrane protein